MAGSWIDDAAWRATGFTWNPDSAIGKYWRQLRSEGRLVGLPVTEEISTPVGMQQAFSSGLVIGWSADDGVYEATDP